MEKSINTQQLRIKDEHGNEIGNSEAARILGLKPYQISYAVEKKGIRTIAELNSVQRDSSGRLVYSAEKFIYPTKYGKLTANEIYDRHPYREHKDKNKRVSKSVISGRLARRGGMCPSLWWEKMRCNEFTKRLSDHGIIDRSSMDIGGNRTEKTYTSRFDRTKTCYRNGMTSRCKHYWALTETFCDDTPDELPEQCKDASGEICPGYDGELLEPTILDGPRVGE